MNSQRFVFDTFYRRLLFVSWLLLVTYHFAGARNPRSAEELTRCIKIAEPLIHNPDYVFPLSLIEIRNVCGKWDEFVDCVKIYTAAFLTLDQQREFDNIIQPSMRSIHQLCTRQDPQYQEAYLYYAPCMKTISIEDKFCGSHYTFLARLAESTADTQPAICCGYHKFRNCVLREARRECDRGKNPAAIQGGGDSTHFVSSMLNRALGFLLQMCQPNESTSKDCLATLTGGRESKINTIDSNVNPIHNNPDFQNGNHPKPTTNNLPLPINTNDDTSNYNYNPRYPSSWSPSYFPSGRTTVSPLNNLSPITVYPPATQGRNKFTWTTTQRSFFPTRNTTFGDFISNEIREPERFRGPSDGNFASIVSPSFAAFSIIIIHSTWILYQRTKSCIFIS